MTTTYPKAKGWPNPRLEQVTALKAEIEELEAEVTRLLERAEAEAREAVAREAALLRFLDGLHGQIVFADLETIDWTALAETIVAVFENPSGAAAALLERLAELETQVADLRGALQAALAPLERAADALVPPGARVEKAWDLIEEAMVIIREEIG